MPLIHWWPLNGDTRDYGVGNVTLTNNGATVDNNGKIGKCYSFNGSSSYLRANAPVGALCQNISFSFWINPNSVANNFTVLSSRKSTGYGLSIFYISGYGFRFDNGNDYTTPSQWQSTVVLEPSQWTHITIIQNDTKRLIYKNGVLAQSVDMTGTNTNTAQYILLGASSASDSTPTGNYLNGKLNDVRIYDHTLSVKEIKEISKGLVLHYNFEDPTVTVYGNKFQGTQYVSGDLAKSNVFTKTGPFKDETGDTYYTFKLNYTGTGSDIWPSIWTSSFAFTVDKRHQYSCDIRVRQCTSNYTLYMRAARSSNDWVTYNIPIVSSSLADGTWKRRNVSNIIPESYNRSGTTVPSNPVWEAYSVSCKTQGAIYSCEFDIKNIQVVEADEEMPFLSNTTNIITDNSGYGNNSTITGKIVSSEDSPIGNYSSYSPSGANYIISENNLFAESFNASQTFTFNIWMKLKSYVGSDWNTIFRLTSSSGSAKDKQLHMCYKSNGNLLLSQYSDDPSYTFDASNVGKWCMVTWVHYKEGSTAKCKFYLNGEQVGDVKSYAGLLNLPTDSKLMLFYDVYRLSYGSDLYISDFKIYSTALSAEDIKAEYNRKASIDRNGNLYTGFFEQNTINIALPTKTGIVKANHYVEGGNKTSLQESYVELEYIESDGNQWIDTGISPTTTMSTEIAITANSSYASEYAIFGSSWARNGYFLMFYGNHLRFHTRGKVFDNSDLPSGIIVMRTYSYAMNTNSFVINNVNISKTAESSESADTSSTIHIFDTPTNPNKRGHFKLHYFQIYDGANLVCDFIPAKRKSDNIIGLYDIVNKQFYTNQGTGTFTAGPELNKLNIIYINELKEI